MLAVPAVGAVAQTLGKGGPQSQSWAQLHAQALVVVVVMVVVWFYYLKVRVSEQCKHRPVNVFSGEKLCVFLAPSHPSHKIHHLDHQDGQGQDRGGG